MPSLWDIAVQKANESEQDSNINTYVAVIGAKQSGKSTIINRYLSKSESAKPTIALEYVFARHSHGLDSAKDVCHIWELGGGTLYTELLDVVLTIKTIQKCSFVITVDLSVPEDIWPLIEELVNEIRARTDQILATSEAKEVNIKEELIEATKKRVGEDQMEKSALLLPVVVLGSKYDIFQDFDSEKKKVLCRGLRFLCFTNGIALFFTSSKSESLLNRTKGVISHLAFDLQSSKTYAVDHNKPLCIPFGTDSIHKIGMSSADEGKDFVKSYDMWKNSIISTFKPSNGKMKMPENPAKDSNFYERNVDMMRQQKDTELEEYMKTKHKSNLNI